MVNTMAFARAMGETHVLDKVTHIGTVSGSSWFTSQFAYSQDFFLNTSGASGSLSLFEYIESWGRSYDGMMTSGAIPTTLGHSYEGLCSALKGVIKASLPDILSRGNAPLVDWILYIAGLLEPNLKTVSCATYSNTPRIALNNVTLLQCVSLPPDAWLSREKGIQEVSLKLGGAAFNYSLPACHVSEPDANLSSWLFYPKDAITLSTTGESLVLPVDPLIATVTSASSSAEGYAGSPTLIKQYAGNVSGSSTDTVSCLIDACYPSGLEVLTTPMAGSWTDENHYVLIDGGFTEVTAAAFTLGKVQADCSAGLFNCSGGLPLIIVDHDKGLGLPPLFTRKGLPGEPPPLPDEPTLFAGYAGGAPGLLAPEPTIFHETFNWLNSSHGGWKDYIPAPLNNGTSARYWTGTLTTVENSLYGVQANFHVKALLLQPRQVQVPTAQLPADETLASVLSSFGMSASPFTQLYGNTNVNQIPKLKAILQEFVDSLAPQP